MSDTTTNSSIGFPSLLTIVFITLKLLGKITWSWWWVLSPLWISAGVGLLFGLFALVIYFIIKD